MISGSSLKNPEKLDAAPEAATVRADWLIYGSLVLCTLAQALVGPSTDADTVAYFDLSEAIRAHRWSVVATGYWFPLYPALLTFARSLFGFRAQYGLMAARLVGCFLELFFVIAGVALVASVRRLMLARAVRADSLLPRGTLYLWTALISWFIASQDLTGPKPDCLLCSFLLLTIAALIFAIAEDYILAYIATGLFGALAFWTKSFAFPFFFLWLFLAAAANLSRLRVLKRLVVPLLIFGLIAGPYIWHISRVKGRFTIGDSGRLDWAWYVNGADRFNPVRDVPPYHYGSARGPLKHPGKLLWQVPEVAYYGGEKVYGSTPQWDDPSYWSDGLAPRFVLHQTVSEVEGNLSALSRIMIMRFQLVVFVAALWCWGFAVRRSSLVDSILVMAALEALAAIAMYALVVLEGRFVSFAILMIALLYAGSAVVRYPFRQQRSLHSAVLLMGSLILLAEFQGTLRDWKAARSVGAHPLHGIYNPPVSFAGKHLAALFGPGTEVACMGDSACWDAYWARYAGVKVTATVGTGNGASNRSAVEDCQNLEQNPAALDVLRRNHIRAIVGRFEGTQPCSGEWRPLERSGDFYYLPL